MITKQVKSVRENVRNFAGKNGTTYIHMITLESPVTIEGAEVIEGEYHSTKATCENFTAGKEATFETEKRVSPDGKYTNYKFKPVKAAGFSGFSAGKKADPKDQGTITALSCASTAANYYQQRQSTPEQVIEFAEKLFQWATSKSTLK